VNDLGDTPANGSRLVNRETFVEGLVGGEYLARFSGNLGGLVSDVDRSIHFPVQEVDACLSRAVCEGHVIEDDAVMLACEVAKVVHVGHDERVLEAVCGPLCFASICSSIDEDNPEVGDEWKGPISIGVSMLEFGVPLNVISDEFDVSN